MCEKDGADGGLAAPGEGPAMPGLKNETWGSDVRERADGEFIVAGMRHGS